MRRYHSAASSVVSLSLSVSLAAHYRVLAPRRSIIKTFSLAWFNGRFFLSPSEKSLGARKDSLTRERKRKVAISGYRKVKRAAAAARSRYWRSVAR